MEQSASGVDDGSSFSNLNSPEFSSYNGTAAPSAGRPAESDLATVIKRQQAQQGAVDHDMFGGLFGGDAASAPFAGARQTAFGIAASVSLPLPHPAGKPPSESEDSEIDHCALDVDISDKRDHTAGNESTSGAIRPEADIDTPAATFVTRSRLDPLAVCNNNGRPRDVRAPSAIVHPETFPRDDRGTDQCSAAAAEMPLNECVDELNNDDKSRILTTVLEKMHRSPHPQMVTLENIHIARGNLESVRISSQPSSPQTTDDAAARAFVNLVSNVFRNDIPLEWKRVIEVPKPTFRALWQRRHGDRWCGCPWSASRWKKCFAFFFCLGVLGCGIAGLAGRFDK